MIMITTQAASKPVAEEVDGEDKGATKIAGTKVNLTTGSTKQLFLLTASAIEMVLMSDS